MLAVVERLVRSSRRKTSISHREEGPSSGMRSWGLVVIGGETIQKRRAALE